MVKLSTQYGLASAVFIIISIGSSQIGASDIKTGVMLVLGFVAIVACDLFKEMGK